jgi:hypothetical protein
MANPAPHANLASTKIAPCPHLKVVQGRLFGMGQSKANQWIHALLPALQVALHTLGNTPARSLEALAQWLGVTVADTLP